MLATAPPTLIRSEVARGITGGGELRAARDRWVRGLPVDCASRDVDLPLRSAWALDEWGPSSAMLRARLHRRLSVDDVQQRRPHLRPPEQGPERRVEPLRILPIFRSCRTAEHTDATDPVRLFKVKAVQKRVDSNSGHGMATTQHSCEAHISARRVQHFAHALGFPKLKGIMMQVVIIELHTQFGAVSSCADHIYIEASQGHHLFAIRVPSDHMRWQLFRRLKFVVDLAVAKPDWL
mmetsp:Transcript_136038/g.339263  ORF Transcript_136038/g.339263 Transcript_136038/m.339263 type:complete len:236 (+) Transcript_136038:966-1673(+)